jgi:outer membrane protein
MKRTWTCLLAVMIAALFVLPAQAAPAKKETKESIVKIGVIDMKRILRDSKAAKNALDTLRKDRDDKVGILTVKMKDLQAMEAEIKSADSKLTNEERREKAEKYTTESRDLKRLQEDMNAEYNKKDAELSQQILIEVVKIIDDYVKKENVTVVVNRTSVVAMDPDADITGDIIKLYDAKK